MPSDIEIAQSTVLEPIEKISAKLGLDPDAIERYGKYKAKVPKEALKDIKTPRKGKVVLVTAMNPTPAGEGKTTVSIGLAQGLQKLGKSVCLALREPSLGPVFGVKGGACGGGYSQVVPMEDINLHFTGDMHAITVANNLLASMIDNHLFRGNELDLDENRILWKRCLDLNDRALRQITVGVGGGNYGVTRPDSFQITAASEIMATLCMAEDMDDLKERLSNIVVGYTKSGKLVTCGQLGAVGSMATLLRDALMPNLVQTIEHVPAFVHGGPFANISHGCNTIIATKTAMKLADFVITEAGFGADLGAEKFLDIKCRKAGITPSAVVIVATVRSLKYNAGVDKKDLCLPNKQALMDGFANVRRHIANMSGFGIPVVVTCNRFPSDTEDELAIVKGLCEAEGASFVPSDVFMNGGEGGKALAERIAEIVEADEPVEIEYTYELEDSIEDKIYKVSTKIYGADGVTYEEGVAEKIQALKDAGYGNLPICIAKTQYSFSDDAKKLGAPKDFNITVRDCYVSAGAGYVVVLTGTILTMPGLPAHPAALDIDVDSEGVITGLF
ncbi:Formate-tetrahydrofolate ligase [Ruminococcaceae bacterium YRB3002]|nr:Formate-tetrahydrofolate ligase [Ruminococcaceae bacterium YRB3002]